MQSRKGSAFRELLSIFLHEDYRLPVLELFAFLFTASVFFASNPLQGYNLTSIAFSYVQSAAVLPLLIFMILIWKNIAFGLGGDFEKGVVQTYLTYPLSRTKLLIARLVSSVLIALGVLALAQFLGMYLVAPQFATAESGVLVFGFLTALANPLLLTSIVLLVAVLTKQGGLSLIVGILLYFVLQFMLIIILNYAYSIQNYYLVVASFLLNPMEALQYYLNGTGGFIGTPLSVWIPNLQNVAQIVVGTYVVTGAITIAAFVWFMRRLEV